jgi:hypothetical protein
MIITQINVALQAYLRLGPKRRKRGRGKKDRDTGYLTDNPDFQFPQEIR